jgi:hypothetical protein
MEEVVPYFLEYLFCCQFTTNEQILDLLEDLAMKRQQCHRINSNLTKYGTDYRTLYSDVLKYFNISHASSKQQPTAVFKNWSSIRKKHNKNLILKKFIIDVKNTYNFDTDTIFRFNRDLMIGLSFKTINDKNIVMRDSKIIRIQGLHLTINDYRWDFDTVTTFTKM